MDTNIIKYPHSELQIFRHYYPDSLIGQANGIDPALQPEPDVHMDFTRVDGLKSCSCGLIYTDSPFHRYGHRNHQTGLPEPLFKYLSPDVYRRRGYEDLYDDYANNTWINCERCSMSLLHSQYVSNGSSHDCWMEPFEQAHCSMENSKRMIIDQSLHFKFELEGPFSKEVVHVTLTPTLDGLKIAPADPKHKETLLTVLKTKTIVFSEESFQNYLAIEPSPAMRQAQAKNETDRNNFLIGSESNSHYRVSYGGGEGLMRIIESDSVLPLGTKFSLTKHHFTRHCIGTGMTTLRIPVISTN